MGKNILIGVTGSVASVKLPILASTLKASSSDYEIRVVTTKASRHFFDVNDPRLEGIKVYTDEDEWSTFTKMGDRVLHIDLRAWADIFVVAPLDANTLAKLAGGLCDNLLTCVARAWDLTKPFVVAPAMNTHMWNHPFTAQHIAAVKTLNIEVIPPIVKTLACGDTGVGAMAEAATIADYVITRIST
eukprot:Colp12_sorted_trinity150504_noHs@13893